MDLEEDEWSKKANDLLMVAKKRFWVSPITSHEQNRTEQNISLTLHPYKLEPMPFLFHDLGDVTVPHSQNETATYFISSERGDVNRNDPNFLGDVQSNFIGTEWYAINR